MDFERRLSSREALRIPEHGTIRTRLQESPSALVLPSSAI
jgi:hypothetical protein